MTHFLLPDTTAFQAEVLLGSCRAALSASACHHLAALIQHDTAHGDATECRWVG